MTAAAPQSGAVTITLPDGSTKAFDTTPTGADVALSIGEGLAKAAIAVEADGIQRVVVRLLHAPKQIGPDFGKRLQFFDRVVAIKTFR